jgi:hypothetical protein
MWQAGDSEILDLFNYSRQKFGTELPLAREVLRLSSFCWELWVFFNGRYDTLKVELEKEKPQKKALLKWFHYYGTGARTETLEIPESVIDEVRKKGQEILKEKCEELAEMCGWYKEHPKRA